MPTWSLLTNHGRALLCIARDPEARLRDIAATLGITERRAHGILTDLVEAGYVVKSRDGRRNRYQIQSHLPLPEPTSQERAIGDLIDLLAGQDGRRRARRRSGVERRAASERWEGAERRSGLERRAGGDVHQR